MKTTRETQRAWIVMALLMFIWGYAWIAAKISLQYASPLDAALIRVVLGTFFLFLFLLWSKASLRPAHIKWLIVVGILQTAAFTIFNTLALDRGEPGRTSIQGPVNTYLIDALLPKIGPGKARGVQFGYSK